MSIFVKILCVIIFLIFTFIFLFKYTDFSVKIIEFLMNFEDHLEKKIESLDDDIKEIERKGVEKDFVKINKIMAKLVSKNMTPIIQLNFEDRECPYAIIGYKHYVSFVRCNSLISDEGIEEIQFDSLEKLFQSDLLDGICLERDWHTVNTWKVGILEKNDKEGK